jgi:hypothetical protein
MESDAKHPMQPAWLGLAMLAYFDREAAPKKPIRAALVFPNGSLALEVGKDGLRITEGASANAEVTLKADRADLVLDLLRGAASLATEQKKHRLVVDGDRGLLSPLFAAFPLG